MSTQSPLSEDLLAAIHRRAADYDERNTFFTEDLRDLSAAGYLGAGVPTQMGGLGQTLAQVAQLQHRLAGAAPATALAINMHQVWVAVAALLHHRGDDSLDFVLRGALEGEVFAFGISEPGNDLVLFGSDSSAVPDGEGGYRFYGTKIFTSLAPAWTQLGTFGMDTTSADAPISVFGFVTRDGVDTKNDWDTLGMRATQSRTTVLDGAYAPAHQVVRRLDPGPNPDPLIFGIFACFEILISAVYSGIAQRALDLAVQAATTRTSKRHDGAPLASLPDTRRRIASAGIALDGTWTQVLALARDVDESADHAGAWFAKLSALKVRSTAVAAEVVGEAMAVAGGASYSRTSELARLHRDVTAGQFHPSSSDSAHQTMASYLLGPVPE